MAVKKRSKTVDNETKPDLVSKSDLGPVIRSKKIKMSEIVDNRTHNLTEKSKYSNVDFEIPVNTAQSNQIKRRRISAKLSDQKNTPQSNQIQRRRVEMRYQKSKRKSLLSSLFPLKPALKQYEMVWVHISSFPNWPGIIEEETKMGKYSIHFFGDYTRSVVTKGKIMHLMKGFNHFSTVEKPSALLCKAIKEAQFFILDTDRASCPICDMLNIKHGLINNRELMSNCLN